MNNVNAASEKLTKAFALSLTAGFLIVLNGALLGVVARWFPGIMPTLPGSSSNDPTLLYSLSIVGLILGVIILLAAIMLFYKPANWKAWGILVIIFSIPSVIMGGGFIIGFILGIMGGKMAFQKKIKIQEINQTTTKA